MWVGSTVFWIIITSRSWIGTDQAFFRNYSVGLGEDCIPLFTKLKSRGLKYIIYRLSEDKKSIISEKTSDEDNLDVDGPEEAKYEAFLANLPDNDCRYAVYDLEYDSPGGEGKR